MATITTDSFFNQTIDVDSGTACWIACPISTINSAIASNIPSDAEITGLKLNVEADFDSVLANVYLQYGFGHQNSIAQHLLNSSGADTKMTSTQPTWYPSGGVDITEYVDSATFPFALRTIHGSYLAFRFYSTNIIISKYKVTAITLTITYETHAHSYTIETSRTASTCCTKGSVTTKCLCGAIQTTELALDTNNHAGGTEIRNAVAATCTATGYTGDTCCKGCGAKLSSGSTIAKLSHSEVTIPAVAPTCTTTGLTEGKKCSVCNTVIVAQQTVAALGHSYSTALTTEGRRKHTCSCGHSYIERAYDVNFDNLFSFADWAETNCAKGSGSGSGSVSYNITDGTITLSGSGDFYTAYNGSGNYYCIPVTAGQEYIFRYDSVSTGGKQAFVFFYNDSGAGVTGAVHNGVVQSSPHIGKYDGSHIVFTVPSGCTKIGIRLGITGTAEATYSNIAIYKTSISDIVNRQYRKVFFAGETAGELYTPIRNRHTFKGWFTGENGTGNQVYSSSKFSESATVFSWWEKLPPEFTSAEMIYGGKQISQTNKVITEQGFIISVVVI